MNMRKKTVKLMAAASLAGALFHFFSRLTGDGSMNDSAPVPAKAPAAAPAAAVPAAGPKTASAAEACTAGEAVQHSVLFISCNGLNN